MASCNFHVGQKVVCIESKWEKITGPHNPVGPKAGQVLTIIGMVEMNGETYIGFPEWDGHGYHHSGFRPVVERKTDISIFRAMLNKTPEQVPA